MKNIVILGSTGSIARNGVRSLFCNKKISKILFLRQSADSDGRSKFMKEKHSNILENVRM